MAKLFRSWNAAIIIAAITSVPVIAVADLAIGDQERMQDPDQTCNHPPDCHPVVDSEIESFQDRTVESNKIVDPDFIPERESERNRMIDQDVDPAESPEGNRIVDPPRETGKNDDLMSKFRMV